MKKVKDIHGQNDNQSILDVNTHIKLLDEFAGEKIKNIANKYNIYYKKYNDIKLELKNNYGDDIEKQRKLDLLKYQLNEIQAANLKDSEEEELENKRKIIVNAEKISENLSEADYCLSEGGADSINSAIKALEKIEDLDTRYRQNRNRRKTRFNIFIKKKIWKYNKRYT